jgi:hypothetical protein
MTILGYYPGTSLEDLRKIKEPPPSEETALWARFKAGVSKRKVSLITT